MLFSSPRNGNFDIYVATLDASGKEALKKLSSETELAPALAAAGHPAGLSTAGKATTSAQAAPAAPAPAPPAAPVAASTPSETGVLPAGISPYVFALGGLAVIWVLVEGVMITRRRSKRRGPGMDGQ